MSAGQRKQPPAAGNYRCEWIDTDSDDDSVVLVGKEGPEEWILVEADDTEAIVQ